MNRRTKTNQPTGDKLIPYDDKTLALAERTMFLTVLGVGAACLALWLLVSCLT